MNAPDELIAVDSVVKHFDLGSWPFGLGPKAKIRAVDGVSFVMRPKDTLSLVGESGSGKTTLTKMLLRLERPTAGRVTFRGKDIHNLSRSDLRSFQSSVQAVFQDPWSSLDPRMRIGDFIAEPLVVNGHLPKTELRDRVDELLTDVGLPPNVARDFPHEFSGGQRQRIAIARAIALHPSLLILDEPVSALDVSIRAQIMNLLNHLREELGVAIVLVSHQLGAVRYMTAETHVMYLGKVVESGPTELVLSAPLHPYTTALLSAELTVRRARRRKRIILQGDMPSPLNPPTGCRFHPRCWLYDQLARPDVCRTEEPALRRASDGRLVACHFADATTMGQLPKAEPTTPP